MLKDVLNKSHGNWNMKLSFLGKEINKYLLTLNNQKVSFSGEFPPENLTMLNFFMEMEAGSLTLGKFGRRLVSLIWNENSDRVLLYAGPTENFCVFTLNFEGSDLQALSFFGKELLTFAEKERMGGVENQKK